VITDDNHHEFDEFSNVHESIDDIEYDDSYDELEEDSDYDDVELERRRVAYSDLKKSDKIFNNTYNLGLENHDEDEYSQLNSKSEIKIDSGSPDYHMYDPERYSDHVDLSIIHRDIDIYVKGNQRVNELLGDEPERKKFTRSEINELFEILINGLTKGPQTNVFINSIHVLDAISALLSVEYKKLFDTLTYENKEILLIELNAKYGFLDSTGRNHKIF
jgi:hypothetical protein